MLFYRQLEWVETLENKIEEMAKAPPKKPPPPKPASAKLVYNFL